MSEFSRFHPLSTAVYFALVIFMSAFSFDPIIALSSLLGSALFCIFICNEKGRLKSFLFYLLIAVLISVTNPLFSHNGKTSLFFISDKPYTLEALVYGSVLSLTVVSVMLWCKAFSKVFSSDKLLCLIGGITPRLSTVISAALRYIPLFMRRARTVCRAQRAVGAYSSNSIKSRIKAHLNMFSALTGWSLENAAETANSMKARGYGAAKRTSYSDFKFRLKDLALLIVCIALSTGVILSFRSCSFYPEIRLPSIISSLPFYICFFIISMIPFLIETEATFRWIYCRSKI